MFWTNFRCVTNNFSFLDVAGPVLVQMSLPFLMMTRAHASPLHLPTLQPSWGPSLHTCWISPWQWASLWTAVHLAGFSIYMNYSFIIIKLSQQLPNLLLGSYKNILQCGWGCRGCTDGSWDACSTEMSAVRHNAMIGHVQLSWTQFSCSRCWMNKETIMYASNVYLLYPLRRPQPSEPPLRIQVTRHLSWRGGADASRMQQRAVCTGLCRHLPQNNRVSDGVVSAATMRWWRWCTTTVPLGCFDYWMYFGNQTHETCWYHFWCKLEQNKNLSKHVILRWAVWTPAWSYGSFRLTYKQQSILVMEESPVSWEQLEPFLPPRYSEFDLPIMWRYLQCPSEK